MSSVQILLPVFFFKFCIILLISFLLFLLEENPKSDDEEDPEIIVVSPPSREHSADSTSTLPDSYGWAVFTTSSPISSTTTTFLPIPSSQDPFKSLSSSSSHFPFYSALHSSSISLSNPPSYSDSLSPLSTHASVNRPSLSLSYTLTTSSPSSLSLSYPIYRPLPVYALPRTTNSLMESIPCLYSSVFSTTPFSCAIMVVLLPWFHLFFLGLSPVVPGERSPEIGLEVGPETTLSILPGDNVLDLLLLVVPCPVRPSFSPYFPLGSAPLAIIILMVPWI